MPLGWEESISLGYACLSIVNYLNEKKVPFLFPAAAHKKYPWVMGWVPSFRFECHISSLQDQAILIDFQAPLELLRKLSSPHPVVER